MKILFYFLIILLLFSFVFSQEVSEEIRAQAKEELKHPHVSGQFLVIFKDGTTSQGITTLLSEEVAGKYEIFNLGIDDNSIEVYRCDYKDRSEEDVLAELKSNDMVEIAEPNYIYTANERLPNDAHYKDGSLWGLKNIEASKAWDIVTGSEIIVAVIDTGVDYNHIDLKSNMWVNSKELAGTPSIDDDKNGYIDDIYGYDFANNDSDPIDDNVFQNRKVYHGTHCAGTIGGVGNNEEGVVGVCWNVKIMAVKFLSAGGSGTSESAAKAIDYAVKNGAKVLSNSWGGGGRSEVIKKAIERSHLAGTLFIAAAGNDGNEEGTLGNNDVKPHYPSSYDVQNIIAVASSKEDDGRSSFSCYGKTSVDIAAPGSNIISTKGGGSNGYHKLNGTSMATPHVSGAVALVWQHFGVASSNLDIKGRVLSGVDTLPNSWRNTPIAGGRLNLYKALTQDVDLISNRKMTPKKLFKSVSNSYFRWMIYLDTDSEFYEEVESVRYVRYRDIGLPDPSVLKSDPDTGFSYGNNSEHKSRVFWVKATINYKDGKEEVHRILIDYSSPPSNQNLTELGRLNGRKVKVVVRNFGARDEKKGFESVEEESSENGVEEFDEEIEEIVITVE